MPDPHASLFHRALAPGVLFFLASLEGRLLHERIYTI